MRDYEVLTVKFGGDSGMPEPMINMERLLAYAGMEIPADGGNEEYDKAMSLFGECYGEIAPDLKYDLCYTAVGFEELEDGMLDIDFTTLKSDTLKTQLEGCEYMVVFGATIGAEVEAAIDKYMNENKEKAKLITALAYERLHTLCDAFGDALSAVERQEGRTLKPYLFPGDGDLPQELDAMLVKVCKTEESIGVTYDEEKKLFTPAFSATAIFCISEAGVVSPFDDCSPDMCAGCGNTSCASRRTE